MTSEQRRLREARLLDEALRDITFHADKKLQKEVFSVLTKNGWGIRGFRARMEEASKTADRAVAAAKALEE